MTDKEEVQLTKSDYEKIWRVVWGTHYKQQNKKEASKMTDFEHIVICAVRYALGRQTYMVGIVCRYVASVIPTLSENCKNLIIKDIKEAERYGYGHKCDEKDWLELLEKLEVDINANTL